MPKPITSLRLHRLLLKGGLRPEEATRFPGEVVVRVPVRLDRELADLIFTDHVTISTPESGPPYVTMARAEHYGVCSPAEVEVLAAFHKRLAEAYAIVSNVLSSLEKGVL